MFEVVGGLGTSTVWSSGARIVTTVVHDGSGRETFHGASVGWLGFRGSAGGGAPVAGWCGFLLAGIAGLRVDPYGCKLRSWADALAAWRTTKAGFLSSFFLHRERFLVAHLGFGLVLDDSDADSWACRGFRTSHNFCERTFLRCGLGSCRRAGDR